MKKILFNFAKYGLWLCAVAVALSFSVRAEAQIIECDKLMLGRARARIAKRQEPFFTYWKESKKDRLAAMRTKANPYLGRDSLKFHVASRDQGSAARLLAYEWQLEGTENSGRHAIEMLTQWASATPLPGSNFDPDIRYPNSGMDVARGMLPFIVAFDLLEDHPAMTADKNKLVRSWFRTLVGVVKTGIQRWEENDDFGKQEYQNHHAAHVLGLVLFGSALKDPRLIRLATDSKENPKDFKEVISGLILMPGDQPRGGLRNKPLHAGEIDDRHRTNNGAGLTYCHLSMTLMIYTAETLGRVTGEDWLNWKADGGECLNLPASFYSDFFRLRNARINGDYYFRDQSAIQNAGPYLGIFEVALSHWPKVPNLKTLVRSIRREKTPRSWLSYYGLPLLTHGVDKP